MIYDDKKFIGTVIRNARKKANLRQTELAEKVGMSDKNLGNIENGKQFPQVNNFLRLLEVLNLSVEDFGVKISTIEDQPKEQLIKEALLSNPEDIQIYSEIISFTKKLMFKK